jgi:hypothetical protein
MAVLVMNVISSSRSLYLRQATRFIRINGEWRPTN